MVSWYNCNSIDSDLIILYPQIDHLSGHHTHDARRPAESNYMRFIYHHFKVIFWLDYIRWHNTSRLSDCTSIILISYRIFLLNRSIWFLHSQDYLMLYYLRICWIILIYLHINRIESDVRFMSSWSGILTFRQLSNH